MKPAAQKLGEQLSKINIQDAKVPVVANVTAQAVTAGADISHLLVEQVYSPVLWQDSVNWLIEQGVDTFVEIGPGNVLAGLIKKIDKTVAIYNVQDMESLEATVAALK
ncbi:Malonyl CoA-acyl carrier protein transacylase [compost metagenome]